MVGQWAKSLIPWRISGSARTLTVNRLSTPQAFSLCTAALEKPHCGNCGVPFMYSTTGWVVTCSRMVSCVLMAAFVESDDRWIRIVSEWGGLHLNSPPMASRDYSLTAPVRPDT